MVCNSLHRDGTIIRNPRYTFAIEIEGQDQHPELPYGDFTCNYTAKEVIGWIAHRLYQVTLKEIDAWIEKNKPILIVNRVESDIVARFNHLGERVG